MTRTTCDRCGKDVSEGWNKILANLTDRVRSFDLCDDCYKELVDQGQAPLDANWKELTAKGKEWAQSQP